MQLPQWLANNLWLKVLSFAIACLIWIFVRVEETAEVVLRIPVRFINVPEQLVIADDLVPEIQVVVEGPRTLLAQVEQGERPSYTIDLDGAVAGPQEVRVQAEKISLPRGVQVVRIMPSLIETNLQPAVRLQLPVKARLTGTLSSGFEISNVEIEPTELEIVVAAGELTAESVLETEPISIDDRKSDWAGVVDVDLAGLHLKSITTRQVQVFLQIVPKMVDRRVRGVSVTVRGPGGPFNVRPQTVAVHVMGPENLVRKLDSDSVKGYVSTDQTLSGPVERPVRVQLPDQVVLLSVEPQSVKVEPQQ